MAGIGLKPAHVDQVLQHGCALEFFEVHAENYMVDGGPWLQHLMQVRARWPLSVHGVGLSIGGHEPPCAEHLARLARLLARCEPRWFSEHLAWSGHGGQWFNDLLPLPYHRASLQRVCDHIDLVQARLRRRLLLENPSTCLEFSASTMDEAAFLGEVVRRTGCGVLLDVNNLHVSAANHGRDANRWLQRLLDQLPAGAVGEIHLAGHDATLDAAGQPLLIDHHGAPVAASVWALYAQAIGRLGPVPTLIERDNHLPELAALVDEAACARRVQAAARRIDAIVAPHPPPGRGPAAACAADHGVSAHAPEPAMATWARALLDPSAAPPPGLRVHHGGPLSRRLAVHRNNVVLSLVQALSDICPALHALLGEARFAALAGRHVRQHPPRSPVMADYGQAWPGWLARHAGEAGLPSDLAAALADLARLELAQVQACHAADAPALGPADLAQHLSDACRLPGARLVLHPSVQLVQSRWPVVSCWAALQGDGAGAVQGARALLPPDAAARPEAALVLRPQQAVRVVPVSAATARLVQALWRGSPLTEAAAAAAGPGNAPGPGAGTPTDFDLGPALATLIQHGALSAWHPGETA